MEFKVLGPLQVADGPRAVAVGGPMQRAVLALLILNPNRVVSMEQVIYRLWRDDPPARATGTVHAYVSNLRRALELGRRPGEPARVLVSQPPGYVLRAAADDVDWLRFERLLDHARRARAAGELEAADMMLAEARDLWRGPALADLTAIVMPGRARLDGLRLSAFEEHVEVLLAQGRHDEVVDGLEALVADHPLRERLRGLQMIALYRAGRQVEALGVYADVRRRLAEEQGLDPGMELRRLHEQILRQDPELEPVRPAVSRPLYCLAGARGPFAGRVAERGVLRAHLSATQAGPGRVVLVEGEPGIGKTRLAEEAATEAAARGFGVLWGRCAETEAGPPLWPWAQVLRAAGDDRALADLVPERTRLDPQIARAQLNQALSDLLRERARARPVLLVLDDLHWADEASLVLLEFLAAQISDARILVLGTYREVELPRAPRLTSTLGVLARLPGTDRVVLHGLGIGEVASLIRARTGAEPAPGVARAVHRRTEGNPFFVVELLRLGIDAAVLGHGPVPVGVRDVIRRRAGRLPHAARRLLDAAALVAREFDLRLVSTACGLEGDAGLEAAEALVAEGLLTVVSRTVGRYRFTHALVQETLAGDLSPASLARLHERIALALLDAHGQDEEHAAEIAEHFWASLPAGGVEETVRAQANAADAAWSGLAYEQAEALLERACTLLRSLPPAASPLDADLAVHIRLGSLLSARHGYTSGARDAFDRARMLAKRLDRHADLLPALWGLGATAVVRGDLAAAAEVTDAALEEARHVRGRSGLATGHQGVGIVAFYRGQLTRARQLFAAALTAWQEDGEAAHAVLRGPPPSARPDVMAPSYDALAACLVGDLAGAQRQITRALRSAETTGEPYAVAFVHSFHARLGVLSRDREAAMSAAVLAIEIAGEHGFPLLAGHAAIPLGWAQAGQGEPETGLAAIERGLAALHRSGQRVLTPFHLGLQADVVLALGDPRAALALLDDALAESAARGGGFEAPGLHHLRGLALNVLGRPEEAQAAMEAAARAAVQQGARVPGYHILSA